MIRYLSRIIGLHLLFIAIFPFVACNSKKDKPTVSPPVRVTVLAVAESNANNEGYFPGTVTSSETTTVSFAVGGTVTYLYASEGQKVKKGQLLGKVRDGDYLNAYNIAKAQLDEAKDGYQRLKKLHDANALPEVKWVEMEQKLKQAQNAEEMAARTLKDADLYSPVSGTVTRKFADVGQTLLPVEPVYEIVSTEALTFDVPVSENAIGDFKVGQKALVKLDALAVPVIEGKVTQKTVVADPLTRSFTVKVTIPSAEGKVLPGMTGNATFENISVDSVSSVQIALPSQAVLLNEDNRLFVWIVREGKAERRFVEADELVTDGVVVKSGLMPGDSVIIEGMQKVGTGSRVIPISKQ